MACLENRGCPRAKLQTVDWHADIPGNDDCRVVEVIFKSTRTAYYINETDPDLKIGDLVVVESAPGHDLGRVNMTGRLVRLQMRKSGVKDEAELKRVIRRATPEDLSRADEAHSREHDTMIRARKIAEDLALNMKIGDVEYQADAAKAIFYYIADERVDFRALIRVLADTFKVRVEMRQIGARQEAGRIGGIGPCGRQLCCSQWMTKFVSVGTGAARIQDLSMNPQKLAGQCAKLKCCLNFETAVYTEAQADLPPKDVTLETKDATYYYFKPDILARTIVYSTDKRIPANLVTISAARAFEIIALNKQGVKVDSLTAPSENDTVREGKEYVDLVEQESLTRFDKSKKKKRKGQQPQKGKKENASAKKEGQPKKENAKPKGAAPQQGQPRKEGQQRLPGQPNTNREQKRKERRNKGAKPNGEAKKPEE